MQFEKVTFEHGLEEGDGISFGNVLAMSYLREKP